MSHDGDGLFRWVALFRDGHTIEQASSNSTTDERQAALHQLFDYIHGTDLDPKKHYLLWFKITDGDIDFIVTFDLDGDAYLTTPGGGMFMTEFKIRSSELIYYREYDRINNLITHTIGFGGINTIDKLDGRQVVVMEDGSWRTAKGAPDKCAIISA